MFMQHGIHFGEEQASLIQPLPKNRFSKNKKEEVVQTSILLFFSFLKKICIKKNIMRNNHADFSN